MMLEDLRMTQVIVVLRLLPGQSLEEHKSVWARGSIGLFYEARSPQWHIHTP